MVFSVLHYHFSKSLPCPFPLLTLPQRCSYALYPKDSSLLSIYRLFKFRLRLHCLQIVNKRVRLHEYLKTCWTNTSPPTSNPPQSLTQHQADDLSEILLGNTYSPPHREKGSKANFMSVAKTFLAYISPGWFLRFCTQPLISLIWGPAPWGLSLPAL